MESGSTCKTQRYFPWPPATIYQAFSIADLLARWWGPEGFTNRFEVFEFRQGGLWKFVMCGPDGKEYPNESVFAVLEPHAKVVIRHTCAPLFTLTVRLLPAEGGTRLEWDQIFDDAATAQAIRHIVEPANEQNLDRLMRVLQA